jgi:DNA-binding transcriptional MocR family regulator
MKKYEQLAQEIESLIAAGTLRPGDRLPSVRESVANRGVSPSTVFAAYYLLESRGAVETRPRAGYFVASHATVRGPEPKVTQPTSGLRKVAVNDLVLDVLGSIRHRDVVPLGSAFPNPALFPLERLARGMGTAMRRLRAREVLENLSPGSEELRRQLALRYVSTGTLASADEIVVTSGAMEALNLCLQAVTRPGDVVAVEAPVFYGCLQALERLQLKAVEVATHPRHGVQLDALAAVLQRHPVKACWFMPTFQNPMGASMPMEQKKALVELLTRHKVPLIEDDVYAELYFGVRRPLPAKSFDREGWVLHCSSFSKSLAPGYRIGWAAAGRFAPQVERLKLSSTLSVAVPSQVAVLHFLLPWRVRQAPAPVARVPARAAAEGDAPRGQASPVGNAVHAAGGWLLPLGGAARGRGCVATASARAVAEHQRRSRPPVLGGPALPAPPAPELRAPGPGAAGFRVQDARPSGCAPALSLTTQELDAPRRRGVQFRAAA